MSNRTCHTLICAASVMTLALLLTGCRIPSELFFSPVSTPPSQIIVPTATEIPPSPTPGEPTPTETPTPLPCAFVYADQSLPDETASLQEAVTTAGIGGVEAVAVAFGENCVDTLNNTVVRFTPMETDFYFTAVVPDREDRTALGNLAGRLLDVLEDFPPGVVPGPNPGYVTLVFQDGTGQTQLRVKLDAAQKARQNGLIGSMLLDMLTSLE